MAQARLDRLCSSSGRSSSSSQRRPLTPNRSDHRWAPHRAGASSIGVDARSSRVERARTSCSRRDRRPAAHHAGSAQSGDHTAVTSSPAANSLASVRASMAIGLRAPPGADPRIGGAHDSTTRATCRSSESATKRSPGATSTTSSATRSPRVQGLRRTAPVARVSSSTRPERANSSTILARSRPSQNIERCTDPIRLPIPTDLTSLAPLGRVERSRRSSAGKRQRERERGPCRDARSSMKTSSAGPGLRERRRVLAAHLPSGARLARLRSPPRPSSDKWGLS